MNPPTRPLRRLLVGLLLATGVIVAFAAPASAHAVLETTTPAAGSTVTTSPPEIRLSFGEPVEISLGAVRLFTSADHEVSLGSATHPGGVGSQVRVAVPRLANGTYVVAWRVVSADSHPVSGAFTFDVGTGSPAAGANGLASRLATEGGSRTVGVLFGVVRWAGYLLLTLIVGGLAFVGWCWDAGPGAPRARRWLLRSIVAALVVGALAVMFQGAYGGGFGIGGVFRPSLWWDVLSTRFGQAHLVDAVLLVAAIPLVRALDRCRQAWWRASVAALSIGMAATVAIAGHGGTGRWVVVGFVDDVIHILGFSFWIGGLIALVAWTLRAEVDPRSTVAASRRFSTLALIAVLVVTVTGVVQGIRQVTELHALVSTAYGGLLLVKVGLVAMVVVVAWVSRSLVRDLATAPVLGADGTLGLPVEPPTPDEQDDEDEDDDPVDHLTVRRYLRRSVGVEVVGVVIVLIVSTLLSAAVPASVAQAQPFDQTVIGDGGFAQIIVEPAVAGTDAIHVTVTNSDGSIPTLAEVDVELSLPDRGIGPLNVTMEQLEPNHFTADAATIPFPGTWTLTVKARVGDFDERVFTVKVPVR